jgi:hypothetical protein
LKQIIAEINLISSEGVPIPDDNKRKEIQGRKIGVCIVDKNSGNFYTNVALVDAIWKPEKEDVWEFD